MSVAFLVVSQLSGRLTNRSGARRDLRRHGRDGRRHAGLCGVSRRGPGAVEAALLVIGVELGLDTAPVQNIAVASVPPSRAGTRRGWSTPRAWSARPSASRCSA